MLRWGQETNGSRATWSSLCVGPRPSYILIIHLFRLTGVGTSQFEWVMQCTQSPQAVSFLSSWIIIPLIRCAKPWGWVGTPITFVSPHICCVTSMIDWGTGILEIQWCSNVLLTLFGLIPAMVDELSWLREVSQLGRWCLCILSCCPWGCWTCRSND